MTSSLGIAPLLKPKDDLHKKWIDRDPQKAVCSTSLVQSLYHEMCKDEEVYVRPHTFLNCDGFATHMGANGHYYCGQPVLDCNCCNGICGPSYGCNCNSCKEIEEDLKENASDSAANFTLPKEHLESWAWGNDPNVGDLKILSKLISHKQLAFFKHFVDTEGATKLFKTNLYVFARFLAAYAKSYYMPKTKEREVNANLETPTPTPASSSATPSSAVTESAPESTTSAPPPTTAVGKVSDKSTSNTSCTRADLVNSGLHIMLKFALKFIEKAWQSGSDSDFCSELLEEAVSMFACVKKVLLFNAEEELPVLSIVMKEGTAFLEKFIDEYSDSSCNLPLKDLKSMLVLLLELAFQSASLTALLRVVLICMDLIEKGILQYAPLNLFLKKFVCQLTQMDYVPEIVAKYCSAQDSVTIMESASELLYLWTKDEDGEEKISEFVTDLMKIYTFMIEPYQIGVDKSGKSPGDEDVLISGSLNCLTALKEEKMKVKVAHVCATETHFVVLTMDGKVLICEHNSEKKELVPFTQISKMEIVQIACSYDGHFIALTKQKELFTWFFANNSVEDLSMVPLIYDDDVSMIVAGFGFYAMLSTSSSLYLWNNDLTGRAKHDCNHEQYQARVFTELEGSLIVDIAFSQYHPEIILVTDLSEIWQYHESKLKLLSNERLGIVKVMVAKYFYVALSAEGQVWRWCRERSNKIPRDDIIHLQSVEKLNKENVLCISVGAYHCIALTEQYNVFCWGGLGGKEEDESLIREPVLLQSLSDCNVTKLTAGPHQIFCWSVSVNKRIDKHVPFCIELKRETFENIHLLLSSYQRCAANETKEILTTSTLKLLKLQFEAAKIHGVSPKDLGFDGETKFSCEMKKMVINYLLNSPEGSEMQKVAQSVIESGWLFLLPSVDERANTLCGLLKSRNGQDHSSSLFLMNILMDCLLQKNGLEEILESAIECMNTKKYEERENSETALYELLKELFQTNIEAVFSVCMQADLKMEKLGKTVLAVLLKFQRLLFARVFLVTEKDLCWPARCYVYEPNMTIKSLTSIISFYLNLLQTGCKQILAKPSYYQVQDYEALSYSPVGGFFNEFVKYMNILQHYAPIICNNCDGIPQMAEILDLYQVFISSLDNKNGNQPKLDARMGTEEMTQERRENCQPSEHEQEKSVQHDGGVTDHEAYQENTVEFEGSGHAEENEDSTEDSEQLSKAIQEAGRESPRAEKEGESSKDEPKESDSMLASSVSASVVGRIASSIEGNLLDDFAGKKVFSALTDVFKSEKAKSILKGETSEMNLDPSAVRIQLEQICSDTRVWLAYLLGLHCCYLSHGTLPCHDEIAYKTWLKGKLFASGINRSAVLKDQGAPESDGVWLADLLEEEPSADGIIFFNYLLKYAKSIGIPIMSSVCDANPTLKISFRLIVCTYIWHIGLEEEVSRIQNRLRATAVDETNEERPHLSATMAEVVRMALKQQTLLIQKHQESPEKSYSELCGPVIIRCKFLCNYLNACHVSQSAVGHSTNRWCRAVVLLKEKYGYGWHLQRWGSKFSRFGDEVCKEDAKEMMQDASKFALDGDINLDILRKCFLIQIKRSKQRLISGYLMQSLCLRQNFDCQSQLLLGWLGFLVPGGSVSNAKPSFLCNVELMPGDDTVKLKDVFKGFESLVLRGLFDLLEYGLDGTNTKITEHIWSPAHLIMLYITLTSSCFMSGDIDFIIRFGVLDKVYSFLRVCCPKTTSETSEQQQKVPFIDEQKNKETHLQEMSGEEIVRVMKIGSRVVRGTDWKWDAQDSSSTNQGRVVSNVGTDGWVRVEWDNGVRNSYRMGKDSKYDLKLAQDVEHFSEVDKDENGSEKDMKENKEEGDDSHVAHLRKSLSSLIMGVLSRAACADQPLSFTAVNIITKFLIKTLREMVEDNEATWGPDISISSILGFVRALCVSKQIKHVLSTEDWVMLITKMCDLAAIKHESSAGNSLFIQVQLNRLVMFLVSHDEDRTFSATWKRSFISSLFKTLKKCLANSPLFSDIRVPETATKAALCASVSTTMAEEVIVLLRYLHSSNQWSHMINLRLWNALVALSAHSETDQSELFSALCVIGGLDQRIHIGGMVRHPVHGDGTVINILPNGKIILQFANVLKQKCCHLSKLQVLPRHTFQLSSLTNFFDQFNLNLGYMIFKYLFTHQRMQWDEETQDDSMLMKVRLFVVALRCMVLVCKDKHMLRNVVKLHDKQQGTPFFQEIVEKSLVHCQVQRGYDSADLEMALLCSSQEVLNDFDFTLLANLADSKILSSATQEEQEENEAVKKLLFQKYSQNQSSRQLVRLLLLMGFPEDLVARALAEVGEVATLGKVICWLVEHTDLKIEMSGVEKDNTSTTDDTDASAEGENEGRRPSSGTPASITVSDENRTTIITSSGNGIASDNSKPFEIGQTVRCTTANGELMEGDVGSIVKVIDNELVLVNWDRLDKSFWTASDFITNTDHAVTEASTAETVAGNIIMINPQEYSSALQSLNDSDVGADLAHVLCDGCGCMSNVGPWYKCNTCPSFYLCERCLPEMKQHRHSSFMLVGNGEYSSTVLKDLDQSCLNSTGDVPPTPVVKSGEDCVMTVLVSSNQHLAFSLMSKDNDECWISSSSEEPHWIRLKLNPNILVSSLSVTVDASDIESTPKRIMVYGGKTNNDRQLLTTHNVKTSKAVVKLLDKQEKMFTYIHIQLFTGDGDSHPPCKIYHLDIAGETHIEYYDQQIMKSCFVQHEKDDMTLMLEEVRADKSGVLSQKPSSKNVKVYCWGLNDKGQLAGIKGSKIKAPMLCEKLSSIKCKDIVGGSKTLFCVTYDGKVYSCGECTHGRLGIGAVAENVAIPRQVEALSHLNVTKIAVHPGGRHAIALTSDGQAYSWGESDDGKLGRSISICDKPQLMEAFVGEVVTDVSCGSNHSAAIVNNSDLYTWGLGDYGRLGHGDEVTQIQPKLVKALLGYNVTAVSCGSRDAQTVCLTDDGNVWSWGDGDFGKLGRGGSDGCFIPSKIDSLKGVGVWKILCGAQFTVALTTSGTVWTWGKGDFYRLGHGTDTHVREPKMVEYLKDMKIVDVAVGALHCLALNDQGEVYAWGDNDHGQQGTGTLDVNKLPTRILGTEDHRINRIACGSSHSIAWAEINIIPSILHTPLPFPIAKDSLGNHLISSSHAPHLPQSEVVVGKLIKGQQPSLIRAIVKFSTRQLQMDALKNVFETLNVNLAHDILLAYMEAHQDADADGEDLGEELNADILDIVKLMKLGLYGRMNEKGVNIIEEFLKKNCIKQSQVCESLVDVCTQELESKVAIDNIIQDKYKPCVQESSHPYHGAPGAKLSGSVKYPGATMLNVSFHEQCQTEPAIDVLTFYDGAGRTVAVRTGHTLSDWSPKLKVIGDTLDWTFITSSPGGLWGFHFTVTPTPPPEDLHLETLSDEIVLQKPCLALVRKLLDIGITEKIENELAMLKLSSLLSMCIRIKLIPSQEKKWMLDHLHKILLSPNSHPVDVPRIMGTSRFRDPAVCKVKMLGSQAVKDAVLNSPLAEFIKDLPQALLKQYEYEEPYIRRGEQMMYSPFLRCLASFTCSLGLDTLPCCSLKHQWAWFIKYCMAIRAANSLMNNSPLPLNFVFDVLEKLGEIIPLEEGLSCTYEKEDDNVITKDEQLLMWLNRCSHNWSIIWGGSGTIYGWGHNHRGQLGGIEGTKIKSPVTCDSLASIKPIQISGGEQTLFCLSGDSKVYATGYGNSSRLGLGIVESVSTPRLIESLQHINIKKIAVHSGGRHSLALSSDGEVYSWGEGDDGKLGHGKRISCNHPKLIEALRGKVVVDVAAGGSHTAAIGEHGELYTWGKGRYGRLGHGDGEEQLRPKVVEGLLPYHVIDVACGSGDAQTVCITSNDMVWSWGDGDYGKLGRDGSDGCKVPMVIEDLTGKGIIKVECGSQFSMALSRDGALYTWGKGDYYRLGHGTEEHVRRPRRVEALAHKFITSISCGSLHCVVCTDDGEVYCWGDNDEGQLGDGTTNAGQLPKLCTALQNKKIDRISCGSAHTIAWSTCESVGHDLPKHVPIEYNHLQDIPMRVLRNRAFLLHSFSKLYCSCIPLMDLVIDDKAAFLSSDLLINSMRGLILSSFKENYFRKIIDVTMVRDRQHGPIIELNRVKKHRLTNGSAVTDTSKSVFGQISSKMSKFDSDSLCLPHRTWKVKFIGESVDDCGGGFSESIVELCEELQNGTLRLLIPTPNSSEQTDGDDCFILNPDACSKLDSEMFRFFGIVIGTAIRSGSPLGLNLAEPVWKQLVGLKLNVDDIEEIDRGFIAKYAYLSGLKCDELPADQPDNSEDDEEDDPIASLGLPFNVRTASGQEVEVSKHHTIITKDNKEEYLRNALKYRVEEFDQQVAWIRSGMAQVVPVPLLSLFTGPELENTVCGNPEISVEALRSITTYRGVEPLSALVKWFWQVLEEFTNHERSLFLRFVWGRTRLPRTALDFKGKDFIFQVLDKYSPPDEYLPESYTCFFLLKLPRYSTLSTLRTKLKYAIYFCKSIDSDDYARINLSTG